VCYDLTMGILSTIFPRSFPRHDQVPEFISDAPQIEEALKEIRAKLSHNKPFEINFQRPDKTRISIDFTGRKLNIDVFTSDGSRLEFKTSDSYMGAVQWGGGINFYNPDGSFAGGGVYPRKFNTALDVFNYTMANLSKSDQKKANRTQAKTLHEPLMDADSRVVETILVSGQLANPKEVAQEGLLPKINLGEEEFTVKHLTNGRLLESKSRKIFLRNNNIHHYRLIDRLDAMIDRDSKPYGNPSELGQLMGVKGMVTTKAQPLYESDGVSLVKREKPIAATLAA
jgi:hypothetical protein